jgi:flavin-binding protein dodecin
VSLLTDPVPTPSSRRRLCRHHRHRLCRRLRLPLRLLPRLALVEDGNRQLPTDQDGLSRGMLDDFCLCPMVRPVAFGRVGTALKSTVRNQRCTVMTQKVIEVVGTSTESFAKAAENAVVEAAKTVRGLKWARVAELEMDLDSKKIAQYRATTEIYLSRAILGSCE